MHCRLCFGSGWVTAFDGDDRFYEFSFICSCPSAAHIKSSDGKKAAKYWTGVEHDKRWTLVEDAKTHLRGYN